MITPNPALSKCGGRQPANSGKSSSVGAGFALLGHLSNSQGRKLAPLFQSLPTQPAASGPSSCRGRRLAFPKAKVATAQDDTLSRRKTAQPRAGLAGLMDPNPVVVTVFPLDGAYHV